VLARHRRIFAAGRLFGRARNVRGDPGNVALTPVARHYDMALRSGKFAPWDAGPGRTHVTAHISTLTLPTLFFRVGRGGWFPLQTGCPVARDVVKSGLPAFEELGHLHHRDEPQPRVRELQRFLADGLAN
jgi:hypothetical protein